MARLESALSAPAKVSASGLTDWAEATLFIEGRSTLSRADLRANLGGLGSEDDAEVDLIMNEVQRRRAVAPTVYPFTADPTGMRRDQDCASTVYEYLLMIALEDAPFRQQKKFARVEYPLDLLTISAFKTYLGPGSHGLRFAWPTYGHRGRFPDAVANLADLLNLETGVAPRWPRKKDGGVDVVAWRPFRDKRSAALVILVQTTLQLDFAPKARDISVTLWNKWIDFGLHPVTALVIPFALGPNDEYWEECRYQTNVIIDRIRLCELLEQVDLTEIQIPKAMKKAKGQPFLQHDRIVDLMRDWLGIQYQSLLITA